MRILCLSTILLPLLLLLGGDDYYCSYNSGVIQVAAAMRLPATTIRGKLRQTALLLGVPSYRISTRHHSDPPQQQQQQRPSTPGPGSPYYPIIPTLGRDPAYLTSPLFRCRRQATMEDEERDETGSLYSKSLPDISVLSSLRRQQQSPNNNTNKKERLVQRILVLALAVTIGVAPILASPQRAHADMDSTMRTAAAGPQVCVVAEHRVTVRVDDWDDSFVESRLWNKLSQYQKQNSETSSSHQLAESKVVSTTTSATAPHQEDLDQRQSIEDETQGDRGNTVASSTGSTGVTDGYNRKQAVVRTHNLPLLSLKITVMAVLVVAAVVGGLEDVADAMRQKMGEDQGCWREQLIVSTTKLKLNLEAVFRSVWEEIVSSSKNKTHENDTKHNSRVIPKGDPKATETLQRITLKVQNWKRESQTQMAVKMLQKKTSPRNNKSDPKRIMLKRSEPEGLADAFSSPLFTSNTTAVSSSPAITPAKKQFPQSSQDSATTSLQQQQQQQRSASSSLAPTLSYELLQTKYSKKYVGLQRNPNSPMVLTYRIDDRPNKPQQPTVNIGLKRSSNNNATATIY